MKRFLIFLPLFPAIATASFYAMLYLLTGAMVDSLSGPALLYLAFIGPGLLMTLVDVAAAKLNAMPAVIATALFGYVVAALAALLVLQSGLNAEVLALGAIGAVPAAGVRGCRIERTGSQTRDSLRRLYRFARQASGLAHPHVY